MLLVLFQIIVAEINVLKKKSKQICINEISLYQGFSLPWASLFSSYRQVDQIVGTTRRGWRRWRRRRRYRRRRRAVLRRRWCRCPGRCDARLKSRETCRRRRTTWRTICTTRCSRRRTTSGGRRGSTRRAVTTAAAAATVRRATRAHGVWLLLVFRRRSRDDGIPSSSEGEYFLVLTGFVERYCYVEKEDLSNIISNNKRKNRIRNYILYGCREQRTCTAACCRDDLSENSSTQTSSHSSRISHTSHRVQVEFNEAENDTNGSSLDFYEAKVHEEINLLKMNYEWIAKFLVKR